MKGLPFFRTIIRARDALRRLGSQGRACATGAGIAVTVCGGYILTLIEGARRTEPDGGGLSPAKAGNLVFGATAARLGRIAAARRAFAKVPDAALVRYALPEAAEALTGSDPERVSALLRNAYKEASTRHGWARVGAERRLPPACASAYLGHAEGVEAFAAERRRGRPARGKAERQTAVVKRLFAEQQRAARALGASADYASVRAAAQKSGRDGRSERGEKVRIGLFDYHSPMESSINLGDYIQTIGVIGQLSRFAFSDLKAQEAVCDLLAQGRFREGESPLPVRNPVEFTQVNRDFPVTVAGEDGPIWLPVCGWFGREAYPGRFDFPFPGNIRPLFMALHIARPALLNDESIAYLRRFEPIGCRDLSTARLLRGAGVKAFFNGCATMTLDRLRPPHAEKRAGRYEVRRRALRTGFGHRSSPHTDPECPTRDFDGNLRAAVRLLNRYHTAEEVRTMLVHCWLPCRAMGVPVTLTEELDRSDPRLDGLVELDDAAFREAALRFDSVAQRMLAAILEGRSEAEVYALWRKVTAPAMARMDAKGGAS